MLIELARWLIVFRVLEECWSVAYLPIMMEALVLILSTANIYANINLGRSVLENFL